MTGPSDFDVTRRIDPSRYHRVIPPTPDDGPDPPDEYDPLTDSAAHRLMLGTMVRIHQSDQTYTDAGLLTLRNATAGLDITTWADLVQATIRRHDVEIRAPRRRLLPGWTIIHVEVLTDPDGKPLPPPPEQGST